jgi:hypothetical protein
VVEGWDKTLVTRGMSFLDQHTRYVHIWHWALHRIAPLDLEMGFGGCSKQHEMGIADYGPIVDS